MRIRHHTHPHFGVAVIDLITDTNHHYASLTRFGAHLLHWHPDPEKPPVFWASQVPYATPSPIRGGIPVCFPWFGARSGQPNHGIVRQNWWQHTHTTIAGSTVHVSFSYQFNGDKNWPHSFALELTNTFLTDRGQLIQELVATNTAPAPQSLSVGFHSYLTVSALANISIEGLSNVPYYDKTTGQNRQHSATPTFPFINECVDFVHHTNSSCTVIDQQYRRAVRLEKKAMDNWVVWNPGPTVNRFSDIPSNSAAQFVCVEPAQVSPVRVAAGCSLTVSHSITDATDAVKW